MKIKYANYKGETYYLHKGRPKKGSSQYFFSKKEEGEPIEAIPKGYEIYENPNGRVFLRKFAPRKITQEEVSIIENGIRQLAKLRDYKIDAKGKTITIFLPDQEMDDLKRYFGSLSPINRSLLDESLKNILTYSPMMRFILIAEEGRKFRVERAHFADAQDGWIPLDGSNDLPKLVRKYCRHLGKDSFYNLI